MITSIVLREIDKNRRSMQKSLWQQEALNVAVVAVRTERDHLRMNGVEVEITKKNGEAYVYEGKTEILRIRES